MENEKTFVSIFHELCAKFGFGLPIYLLEKTRGKSPNQSFKMSLTVLLLDISGNFLNNKFSVSCNIEMNIFVVTASGRTKKLAKHNCAFNIMVEIKKRDQEILD